MCAVRAQFAAKKAIGSVRNSKQETRLSRGEIQNKYVTSHFFSERERPEKQEKKGRMKRLRRAACIPVQTHNGFNDLRSADLENEKEVLPFLYRHGGGVCLLYLFPNIATL